MMDLITLASLCKKASTQIMNATTEQKNLILEYIALGINENRNEIMQANQIDLENGKARGMNQGLLDRMLLNDARLDGIIEGVYQVKALNDPIGELCNPTTLANGLHLQQMRVALGVVGMIYEARPNVSVDAAILCLKAGNACMLRGSKDIINSNQVLVKIMREALEKANFDPNIICLLEDTSYETANQFMKLNGYIDVLIPRGSAKLIKNTLMNASVPVLETGSGNCHTYVDKDADLDKALPIIMNAKTQRTSVCNACESILIHKEVNIAFIKQLIDSLHQANVIIHGDEMISSLNDQVLLGNEEDWAKEYLDLEVSIKMVDSLQDAIDHINQYSTQHSEAIISENSESIQKFLKEVDSACVYANASTRFSDGFEFGLGAEIGISTQKLHARGPMGLKALTTLKYIIQGNGQIRK